MKVAVVGPGALGCLFAAKFWKAGAQVTLLDHRPLRAEKFQASGLLVEESGACWDAHPDASTVFPENLDLILVLCKAHSTALLQLPKQVPTLTLQNGLNNAEILAEKVGADYLLAGSTALAVTRIADGHVRYVAPGLSIFGAWTVADVSGALELFSTAGFEVEHTPKPAEAIWRKAVLNSAINPLTALLNVQNGRLLEIPDALSLLHELLREAASVSKAEGFEQLQDPVHAAESVCRATAQNVSSMLQDIRNGSMTEIDSLSGELLRRAHGHGLHVPQTRTVWQLVRALEWR